MVEEAGAVLTKQLVDTASLLAVLLFGLLFFLVTVSVFVKLAYDSYKRKDYTQVDYLINGMYSDSGVWDRKRIIIFHEAFSFFDSEQEKLNDGLTEW